MIHDPDVIPVLFTLYFKVNADIEDPSSFYSLPATRLVDTTPQTNLNSLANLGSE